MNMLNLSKCSILVLEKNTLLCSVLIDVFKSVGVPTLLSTADPEIAFDRFKALPIDIVISDWSSDLDSSAFLKRLRTDPESPNPFVPVIICKAKSELRDVCEARDTGMTEYLTKPVSANQIYSRIDSLIEQDRQFIRISDFIRLNRRHHRDESYIGTKRRKAFNN